MCDRAGGINQSETSRSLMGLRKAETSYLSLVVCSANVIS